MTQDGLNLIKCDVPECDVVVAMPTEMLHNGAVRGDEAIQWAIKDGWTHTDATDVAPALDICPFHMEKES